MPTGGASPVTSMTVPPGIDSGSVFTGGAAGEADFAAVGAAAGAAGGADFAAVGAGEADGDGASKFRRVAMFMAESSAVGRFICCSSARALGMRFPCLQSMSISCLLAACYRCSALVLLGTAAIELRSVATPASVARRCRVPPLS